MKFGIEHGFTDDITVERDDGKILINFSGDFVAMCEEYAKDIDQEGLTFQIGPLMAEELFSGLQEIKNSQYE